MDAIQAIDIIKTRRGQSVMITPRGGGGMRPVYHNPGGGDFHNVCLKGLKSLGILPGLIGPLSRSLLQKLMAAQHSILSLKKYISSFFL